MWGRQWDWILKWGNKRLPTTTVLLYCAVYNIYKNMLIHFFVSYQWCRYRYQFERWRSCTFERLWPWLMFATNYKSSSQCSSISQNGLAVIAKKSKFSLQNNKQTKQNKRNKSNKIFDKCKTMVVGFLWTEICQRLLYRSAGTRLASLNFVCRRFWHTASSRSSSEHVEVHTGTGNICDVARSRHTPLAAAQQLLSPPQRRDCKRNREQPILALSLSSSLEWCCW